MDSEFNALLVEQNANLRSVLRFLENFKKIGQPKMTLSVTKGRLQLLKEKWMECQRLDVELTSKATKEQLSETYFTTSAFLQAEEAFLQAYDYLQEKIGSLSKPVVPVDQSSMLEDSHVREHTIAVRLPKLDLPRFSGAWREWVNYRNLFESLVHDNAMLSDVQRLQYLKSSLEGEPSQLVRHVQISAENYLPTWKLLNERYNNERALVNAHLSLIFGTPSVHGDVLRELRTLRDNTNEGLLILKNLGRPVDQWDDLIVYIITQRLDKRTLVEWEMQLGSNSEVPSFKELDDFLLARIRSLEAIKLSCDGRASNPLFSSVSSNKKTGVKTHLVEEKQIYRCLCGQSHPLYLCRSFKELPVEKRKDFARQQGRCFNCLRQGHLPSSCPSKTSCRICNGRHHSMLHGERLKEPSTTAMSSTNQRSLERRDMPSTSMEGSSLGVPVNSDVRSNHLLSVNLYNAQKISMSKRSVFLATALVNVLTDSGRSLTVRALLDQGSEASFASESLVQTLGVRREKASTDVSGVGETHIGTARARVTLTLRGLDAKSPELNLSALVLPKLSSYSPKTGIEIQRWSHLCDLKLADPGCDVNRRIELIIGADYYGSILREGLRRGPPDAPIAQLTIFGWVISGPFLSKPDTKSGVSLTHCTTSYMVRDREELHDSLRRFWEIEEPPRTSLPSEDEKRCEDYFKKTHSRLNDGRYVVRIPFNTETPPRLGNSLSKALRTLRRTQARFDKDSHLRAEYSNFMSEYERLGHMVHVPTSSNDFRISPPLYLPHHPVVKQDSLTTKLRVVFNASSLTSDGKSLNDYQLIGHKLQTDIVSIVSSWRQYRFVYKADIEKMFRQIRIHDDDVDYQRIVWSPSWDEVPKHYRLLTVTYGTASAPFLANRVLKQLAEDEGRYFPRASQILKKCFYVDDVFFGSHDLESFEMSRQELISLMERGGFTLHKWASNNLTYSARDEETSSTFSIPSELEPVHKVLGLSWNSRRDCFYFQSHLPPLCPASKREILSLIARLYDPLGWIAPVIIVAKILIQDLWLKGALWDDPLPNELGPRWEKFYDSLPVVGEISIPRWLRLDGGLTPYELHGFADASSRAYAAVIYLRVLRDLDRPEVSLIIAKTKVAPIKTVSIPRLELCAAVLLVRMLHRIVHEFKLFDGPITAWTDSSVVLAWLGKHPIAWKPFVANRVTEIHELLPRTKWRHVPSKDNPADCASRGLLPNELVGFRQWWEGPSWLSRHSSAWPLASVREDGPQSAAILTERRPSLTRIHNTVESTLFQLPGIVSSWPKLLRVTSYVLAFINKLRKSARASSKGRIPYAYIDEALLFWLKTIQTDVFSKEIDALKSKNLLPASSKLKKLDPFIDDKGLLRVGGRLRNSFLSFENKHPIILPRHRVAELLAQQVHVRTLHGGTQLVLHTLRREYWILDCRRMVKRIVHSCCTCVRQRAAMTQQFMSDLPVSRVTPSPPFSSTGIDYAGPLMIRAFKGRGHKSYKAYIALFVCLSTKAVHLELVSDCTTSGFLSALKRFTSRRGRPAEIYSDNGTNFHGANKEMRKTITSITRSDDIVNFVTLEGIKWKFIPPGAPNFGGLWEAGVKSVKFHLRRVVGQHTLTFEEMTTLLCLIEACLNSRPLAPLSDDPDDLGCLTPGHFLIGKPLIGIPEKSRLEGNENLLTRWQLVYRMQEQFWKRWRDEYLHTLQQRPKWLKKYCNIQVGSLVLIRHPNTPPTQWRLGRVISLLPGTDGLVRVVKLHTSNGTVTRPVTQLCVLPVHDQNTQSQTNSK